MLCAKPPLTLMKNNVFGRTPLIFSTKSFYVSHYTLYMAPQNIFIQVGFFQQNYYPKCKSLITIKAND